MEDPKKHIEIDTSRRDFILAAVMAASAGTAACNPFSKDKEGVVPSGEKVKLLSVDGEIIEVDRAYIKPVPNMPTVSRSEERVGVPGKKFVMVIDLSRCKNLKNARKTVTMPTTSIPGRIG